uniref:Single-pass membrane protein with coiled-coil domains 2 n=1 Tax=Rousettus aegyptiacus TaxID=9407 RepID=A0A7J8JMV9_ROUAE|nr:single-pass membrane protein with coiled-coil domains 2 [Rousettus aegyptiacus]
MSKDITSLLREFNKMDHFSDRSDDDEGIFLENPQTDYIQEVETKKWNMLELEAEHNQDLRSEQDEEETVQHEDPQVSTSLQFSEENIPELSQENMFFQLNHWNTQMGLQVKELGADHMGWMEKINNIIQKINLTETTVKSVLNEVVSLEGQIEKLESHQDFDPAQGTNIEADACNEAHELKEKLVVRKEETCTEDFHHVLCPHHYWTFMLYTVF